MKKKGFTLIELLAVIVILAIISLIATPIILNIIEKARKEAFKDTAYGIISAAELQYTEGIMDNKVKEKLYTFPQEGEDKLKFSGAEPKGGDVKITNNGKVSIAIHNGDWCAKKTEEQSEIIVTEYTGQCSLVEITYTPEECFTFDKSTGTITDYDKSNDKCGIDVVIPEKIDGITVKVIGERAFTRSEKYINSVAFPSGLEEIQYSAFIGYTQFEYSNTIHNKITSLDFSRAKKLKIIDNKAFWGNPLTNVEIPPNITIIKTDSFPTEVINNYNDEGFIIINGNLLDYTGTSKDVIIPNGVTSIGDNAFYDNQLTSVEIPDSVTNIGSYAFYWNQLTSVTIPTSVKAIGDYAFYSNPLTSVVIPSSVTTIYYYSFPYAVIDSYYDQNGFLIINGNLLGYTGTEKNITISSTVTSIRNEAFLNDQLTSVVIPDSVTSIGYAAFASNQLTSLTLGNSVKVIENEAFKSNQLTSVEIPNSVTSIGGSAFSWNKLTNVTIGDSVTSIGAMAFYGNKLTSVTIPESVTSIGEGVFHENQLTSVTIKGKSSSADFTSYPSYSPFGWASGYSDSNIIWNG